MCPRGQSACGVYGGSSRAYECVDTSSDLESCKLLLPDCMRIHLTISTLRWRLLTPAQSSGSGGRQGLYFYPRCFRRWLCSRGMRDLAVHGRLRALPRWHPVSPVLIGCPVRQPPDGGCIPVWTGQYTSSLEELDEFTRFLRCIFLGAPGHFAPAYNTSRFSMRCLALLSHSCTYIIRIIAWTLNTIIHSFSASRSSQCHG